MRYSHWTGRASVVLRSFSQVIQKTIYLRIAGSNSHWGTKSSFLLWRRRYTTCCSLQQEATGGQSAAKCTESIWTGCLLVKHFSSIWRIFPVSKGGPSLALRCSCPLCGLKLGHKAMHTALTCTMSDAVLSHRVWIMLEMDKKIKSNVNLVASTNIFFLILKTFANSWSMLWNLSAFFSTKSIWEYFYEQKHYEIYPNSYAILHFTKNWVSSPENFLWHLLKPVQQNLQRHQNKKD